MKWSRDHNGEWYRWFAWYPISLEIGSCRGRGAQERQTASRWCRHLSATGIGTIDAPTASNAPRTLEPSGSVPCRLRTPDARHRRERYQMPKPDKDFLIYQGLLSAVPTVPVPDTVDWWKQVAQGLAVKLFDANQRLRAMEDSMGIPHSEDSIGSNAQSPAERPR